MLIGNFLIMIYNYYIYNTLLILKFEFNNMYRTINNNVNGMEKTPCIFDNGQKPTSTVYSDRLHQWDYKKHNELCKKHFGNEGQYWGNREPELIEAFLRDYLNDQSVLLCRIEEHENRATGYLLWRFDYSIAANKLNVTKT